MFTELIYINIRMTIIEKIINAIKEKEKEINNNLYQDIFIEIRNGTILICSHKVLWKPKK